MPLIYLLTSPSNKSYVGQTVQTLHNRLTKHKSKAKLTPNEGCIALNYAIRKYGLNNFEKEIILECDEDELDYYEDYYISEYDTLAPNGYNLMTGGNSNKRMSEKTKEKMRLSALKRTSKAYRKSEKTKDFPKFLQVVETKYSKGYRITKHPNCPCKSFFDKNKTMEEKKQEALDFLEKLNLGEVVVKKKVRELPEGIQNASYGYRIYWKNSEGKLITKRFGSSKMTKELKLKLAIEHLAKLQEEDLSNDE